MKTNLFQPQLFLDDRWLEASSFVMRISRQPKKFPNLVLTVRHPWEQCCPILYDSVLHRRGPAIVGEHSSQRVARKNEKSLRELARRRIRFAFCLHSCHLYSIRAVRVA
jgi:hypothetical protein